MEFPYIELNILNNVDSKMVRVDGYHHEDETQEFDNFIQSFHSLDTARQWASEYDIPVKETHDIE